MGAGNSTANLSTALVPQTPSIIAIDKRYSEPNFHTTLHLKESVFSAFGENFKVHEMRTKTMLFQFRRKTFSMHNRQEMLNSGGHVIVNTKDSCGFTSKRIRNVFLGNESDDNKKLFTIIAVYRYYNKMEITFEFRDRITGTRYQMGMDGNWERKDAIIWVMRAGSTDRRETIARVYIPRDANGHRLYGGLFRSEHYYVDIAPGVDMAMITLLCTVLDEEVIAYRHRKRSRANI